MKGERGGVGIKEFDGLRSKTYSLLVHNNSKQKKAKGVNKHFVKNWYPVNIKTLCWIKTCLNISWIEFKVKIID